MASELLATATVTGVDSDADVIAQARDMTEAFGLEQRLTFVEGDATECDGATDAIVCIGVEPPGVSRAIVGDGIWQAEPDPWCLDTFGPLADGVDGLAAMAAGSGWSVDALDTSTIDEWDDFEHRWIAGVRSVGSPKTAAFADQRSVDYQRYRGILGFGWLHLSR